MKKRDTKSRIAGKRCRTGVIGGLMALSMLATGHAVWAEEGVADQEKIQAAVHAEIERMLSDGSFDDAIGKGIASYISTQRRLAREREERGLQKRAKNLRPVAPDADHIYGNPQAGISLVEYSDFECPFCKRFHPNAKKLVDQSNGEINWVYRHFPLEFHNPGAQKEAEATECAAEQGGNDAFWKFTDLIYKRTKSNGKGFPITDLVPLATEIGLDGEKFSTCLDSGKMAERVKKDYENGALAGVNGTPGNFLLHNKSGKVRVLPGAVPVPKLQASVEKLRQASAQN